jgi:hypothetical protein
LLIANCGAAIAATEEELPVSIAGKPQKRPAIDLICKQLVRKAVAGDVRCMLKTIELRENYSRRHADEQAELMKRYLDASRRFQRNPEDHTVVSQFEISGGLPKYRRTRLNTKSTSGKSSVRSKNWTYNYGRSLEQITWGT